MQVISAAELMKTPVLNEQAASAPVSPREPTSRGGLIVLL